MWQWTEKTTLSAPGTRSRTRAEHGAVLVRRGVADRVGQVDGGGAGLDGRLDAAAEIVDRRARGVHGATTRHPRRDCAPGPRSARMISSTCSSVLRIWCARWIGEVETKVWMRGRAAWPDRLARAGDVGGDGARQTGDDGVLGPPGDLGHGLEVAVRGDREAGLDDVDAHGVEQFGDLELLLQASSSRRGIARRRAAWCRKSGRGPWRTRGGLHRSWASSLSARRHPARSTMSAMWFGSIVGRDP